MKRWKKAALIVVWILLHLIVSRFVIRITDATVQIDGNLPMLLLLLAAVNGALWFAIRTFLSKRQRRGRQ